MVMKKSEILVRRDILLKEFYYMKQVAGTDASLEPEPDFAKIDEAKLKAFQEQHQLSEYGLENFPPLPLQSTKSNLIMATNQTFLIIHEVDSIQPQAHWYLIQRISPWKNQNQSHGLSRRAQRQRS